MTQAEAVTVMKTECKILADALSDDELIYMLTKNSKYNSIGTIVYNINRAICDALRSAITVLPISFSRGGVVEKREDLRSLLKEYQRKAMVGNADFPGVGIGVIIRDLSN